MIFKEVYEISDYWGLKRFPLDIYVYAFHNKKEVIDFLEKSERDGSLELIEDINNNKSLLKYKAVIQYDFESPKLNNFYLREIIDITENKYLIFKTGYTARIAESDSYNKKSQFVRYTYNSLVEFSKSRNIEDLDEIKIQVRNRSSKYLDFEEYNVHPILIYDKLWSEESKKELNSDKKGIFIYNDIDLNIYIDDILKVLNLKNINGIIMFEKIGRLSQINFLENIDYCNLYGLTPIISKYSDPPVNVLNFDSESG